MGGSWWLSRGAFGGLAGLFRRPRSPVVRVLVSGSCGLVSRVFLLVRFSAVRRLRVFGGGTLSRGCAQTERRWCEGVGVLSVWPVSPEAVSFGTLGYIPAGASCKASLTAIG